MNFNGKWQEEVESHVAQVKKKIPEKYSHFATMLYGSQNYGLESSTSDVDTKTMVVPSAVDLVLGRKMLSKEYQMEDGSLDTCKDLRAMFENYMKGNINFTETLFSPYVSVNSEFDFYWRQLKDNKDLIANAHPRRLMHMAAAMATQKYKAMEHPFESKREVLAKYGYDPKQLHHIVRLKFFMETYMDCCDFKNCLEPVSFDKEYLMNLKLYPISLGSARRLAIEKMAEIDDMVNWANNFLPENYRADEAQNFLNNLAVNICVRQIGYEFYL